MAGAAFGDLGVPLFVAGALFGDLGMSLFMARAAFGDVGASLFVAGTVLGEIWVASANGRVRDDEFILGSRSNRSRIVNDSSSVF